jgi:hypothetical protein
VRKGGAAYASAGARRLLLRAFVAFLVVAGLLAMHVITADHRMATPGDGSPLAVSSVPGHTTTTTSSLPSRVAAESSGSVSVSAVTIESRTHAAASVPNAMTVMITMACVLAVLSFALLWLVPRLLAGIGQMGPSALLTPRAAPETSPIPRPPSLYVLSISRT